MADNSTEIVLKLSIDNKDYEARIAVSKQEMVELAKATGISEKQLLKSFEEMQKGMDKTAASVDKIKSSFEKVEPAIKDAGEEGKQFGYNLGQDFDGVNVTLAELSERLDDLKERFGAAAIGSEEYNHLANEIQIVQGHLQRVKEDLTKTGAVTNITTAQTGALRGGVTQVTRALMELDPRIGSVVQGLGPFINGFNTASMKGGGFKQTLTAITGQLAGPMGLGLAITGVAILLKTLPDLFGSTTEKVKEQAEEVKKLRNEYETLTRRQLEVKRAETEAEISKLTSEFQQKYGSRSELLKAVPLGLGKYFESFAELGEKEKERYETLIAQKKAIDETASKLGYIKGLENELNLLMQKRKEIKSETAIRAFDEQIEYYQKLVDEASIDAPDRRTKKIFEQKKSELEIVQRHTEFMLSLETENDLLVEKLKYGHLAQMIELYKKYGQDVTGLQLELSKREIEIAAKADSERKALLEKVTGDFKKPDDIPLDDLKIASSDELRESEINGIQNQYEREYALLDLWKERELERYADDAAMKAAIDAEYLTKKNELQHAQAEAELQMAAQTLDILSGMINENTAVGKALAVTTAIINTYEGASKAIAQGGIFGPALAAMVVAAGMANVSKIVAVNQPKMKGYATGGILEPGKAGFIEGTHRELIAPEKDFISVVNDLVARSQIAIAGGYSGSGAIYSNKDVVGELKFLRDEIKDLASRPARAFLDNDEAMKIGEHYDYEIRKEIG